MSEPSAHGSQMLTRHALRVLETFEQQDDTVEDIPRSLKWWSRSHHSVELATFMALQSHYPFIVALAMIWHSKLLTRQCLTFEEDLGLHPLLLRQLKVGDWTHSEKRLPTQFQKRILGPWLQGKDMHLSGPSGCGKRTAIALGVVQRILLQHAFAAKKLRRSQSQDAEKGERQNPSIGGNTSGGRIQALILCDDRYYALELKGLIESLMGAELLEILASSSSSASARSRTSSMFPSLTTHGESFCHLFGGKDITIQEDALKAEAGVNVAIVSVEGAEQFIQLLDSGKINTSALTAFVFAAQLSYASAFCQKTVVDILRSQRSSNWAAASAVGTALPLQRIVVETRSSSQAALVSFFRPLHPTRHRLNRVDIHHTPPGPRLTLESFKQFYVAVEEEHKPETIIDLLDYLVAEPKPTDNEGMTTASDSVAVMKLPIVIFVNDDATVDRVSEMIETTKLPSEENHVTHGFTKVRGLNKKNRNREGAILESFRNNEFSILVTTEIDAVQAKYRESTIGVCTARNASQFRPRTLLEKVMVVNYSMHDNVEGYFQRVAVPERRWGPKTTCAISFFMQKDVGLLRDIEKYYHTELEELPMDFIQYFE